MIRACTFKPLIRHSLKLSTKKFHSGAVLHEASIFRMPAMSPTMTEGGVVSWKFKAGDNFSAGDVLLEVETDKATIDVEAQDDGTMWEILVDEGSTGVAVGKPIAYLAEQGDDLSTLEKPADEAATPSSAPAPSKEEENKIEPASEVSKSEKNQSLSSPSSSSDILVKANPQQKLLPSVELLLHQHNISKEEALEKIQASGPKGRILKGDVLTYLGEISEDSVVKVAKFIKSREHLDLSNIVLAEPKAVEAKSETACQAEPVKPTNILTVQFSSELGEDISREKFKYAFERSVESAIRVTYSQRFPEYANSPSGSSLSHLDIFDDLMSPSVTKSRFEVYDISYKFHGSSASSPSTVDEFDELLGLSTPIQISHQGSNKVDVEFKIKFDQKLIDAKEFVDYFQDSLLTQIPANELRAYN